MPFEIAIQSKDKAVGQILFKSALQGDLIEALADSQKQRWFRELALSGNEMTELLESLPSVQYVQMQEILDLDPQFGKKLLEATNPGPRSKEYFLKKLSDRIWISSVSPTVEQLTTFTNGVATSELENAINLASGIEYQKDVDLVKPYLKPILDIIETIEKNQINLPLLDDSIDLFSSIENYVVNYDREELDDLPSAVQDSIVQLVRIHDEFHRNHDGPLKDRNNQTQVIQDLAMGIGFLWRMPHHKHITSKAVEVANLRGYLGPAHLFYVALSGRTSSPFQKLEKYPSLLEQSNTRKILTSFVLAHQDLFAPSSGRVQALEQKRQVAESQENALLKFCGAATFEQLVAAANKLYRSYVNTGSVDTASKLTTVLDYILKQELQYYKLNPQYHERVLDPEYKVDPKHQEWTLGYQYRFDPHCRKLLLVQFLNKKIGIKIPDSLKARLSREVLLSYISEIRKAQNIDETFLASLSEDAIRECLDCIGEEDIDVYDKVFKEILGVNPENLNKDQALYYGRLILIAVQYPPTFSYLASEDLNALLNKISALAQKGNWITLSPGMWDALVLKFKNIFGIAYNARDLEHSGPAVFVALVALINLRSTRLYQGDSTERSVFTQDEQAIYGKEIAKFITNDIVNRNDGPFVKLFNHPTHGVHLAGVILTYGISSVTISKKADDFKERLLKLFPLFNPKDAGIDAQLNNLAEYYSTKKLVGVIITASRSGNYELAQLLFRKLLIENRGNHRAALFYHYSRASMPDEPIMGKSLKLISSTDHAEFHQFNFIGEILANLPLDYLVRLPGSNIIPIIEDLKDQSMINVVYMMILFNQHHVQTLVKFNALEANIIQLQVDSLSTDCLIKIIRNCQNCLETTKEKAHEVAVNLLVKVLKDTRHRSNLFKIGSNELKDLLVILQNFNATDFINILGNDHTLDPGTVLQIRLYLLNIHHPHLIAQLSEEQIKDQVSKLDPKLLTVTNIGLLDKRVRMTLFSTSAIVKWNAESLTKQVILVNDFSRGDCRIIFNNWEKWNIADSIRQSAQRSGLVLLMKAHPSTVTKYVLEHQDKALACTLLNILDARRRNTAIKEDGSFWNWLYRHAPDLLQNLFNTITEHDLVKSIIYHSDGTYNDVLQAVTNNQLVADDIVNHWDEFLSSVAETKSDGVIRREGGATVSAFEFLFNSSAVMQHQRFTPDKMNQAVENAAKRGLLPQQYLNAIQKTRMQLVSTINEMPTKGIKSAIPAETLPMAGIKFHFSKLMQGVPVFIENIKWQNQSKIKNFYEDLVELTENYCTQSNDVTRILNTYEAIAGEENKLKSNPAYQNYLQNSLRDQVRMHHGDPAKLTEIMQKIPADQQAANEAVISKNHDIRNEAIAKGIMRSLASDKSDKDTRLNNFLRNDTSNAVLRTWMATVRVNDDMRVAQHLFFSTKLSDHNKPKENLAKLIDKLDSDPLEGRRWYNYSKKSHAGMLKVPPKLRDTVQAAKGDLLWQRRLFASFLWRAFYNVFGGWAVNREATRIREEVEMTTLPKIRREETKPVVLQKVLPTIETLHATDLAQAARTTIFNPILTNMPEKLQPKSRQKLVAAPIPGMMVIRSSQIKEARL